MNIIDELHKGKQSIEKLCKIYYYNILRKIDKIREDGQEFTKESYEIFKKENPGMEFCTFQDVEALIDLAKQWDYYQNYEKKGKFTVDTGEKQKKQIQVGIKRRTNIALARRLATEMKTCSTLLTEDDYQILYNLGYKGELDRNVPEIVTGNFKIFMENKRLRSKSKGKIETINRIQIFLDNVPVLASKKKQELAVRDFLTGEGYSIESIERALGERCFEDDWDRLKYLEEFSKDRVKNLSFGQYDKRKNKFVTKEELKRNMLKGTLEVTKETYANLAYLGYDEYNVHELPIIQSGFELYRENWIQNKMIERYSEFLEPLGEALSDRNYAYSYLQPEVDPSINAMSSLDIDLQILIVNNEYKKGKISKEDYLEIKQRKDYIDRGGNAQFIPERIKGVKGPSKRRNEYDR